MMATTPITIPMSGAELASYINDLVTLVNELKADLAALRNDFRAHDHGGTYTPAATRLNASANTFSGTAEQSSAVSAADATALPANAIR